MPGLRADRVDPGHYSSGSENGPHHTRTDTHRNTHAHMCTQRHPHTQEVSIGLSGSGGCTCSVTARPSWTRWGRWGLGEGSGRLPAPQAWPRPATPLRAQPSGRPELCKVTAWIAPWCPIWKGGGGATLLHAQLASPTRRWPPGPRMPVPGGEGGMVTSRGSASRAAVAQSRRLPGQDTEDRGQGTGGPERPTPP